MVVVVYIVIWYLEAEYCEMLVPISGLMDEEGHLVPVVVIHPFDHFDEHTKPGDCHSLAWYLLPSTGWPSLWPLGILFDPAKPLDLTQLSENNMLGKPYVLVMKSRHLGS